MKKFILGKKIGMTQVFGEGGVSVPVTVVEAGPNVVVQMKTVESDGYHAVKVGFEDANEKRVGKPGMGMFNKIGVKAKKHLKEFRVDDDVSFEVGKEISVAEMFQAGEKIDASAISKGKGFQGVIKRHGQSIGRKSHGSHFHRHPGAMAGCSYPGRVFKGKELPGHMGNVRITIQNLEVVRVDEERNLLLIKGSIPGARGRIVEIKETVKK